MNQKKFVVLSKRAAHKKQLIPKKWIITSAIIGTVVAGGILGTVGGLGYFSPSNSNKEISDKEKLIANEKMVNALKTSFQHSNIATTTLGKDVLTIITTRNKNTDMSSNENKLVKTLKSLDRIEKNIAYHFLIVNKYDNSFSLLKATESGGINIQKDKFGFKKELFEKILDQFNDNNKYFFIVKEDKGKNVFIDIVKRASRPTKDNIGNLNEITKNMLSKFTDYGEATISYLVEKKVTRTRTRLADAVYNVVKKEDNIKIIPKKPNLESGEFGPSSYELLKSYLEENGPKKAINGTTWTIGGVKQLDDNDNEVIITLLNEASVVKNTYSFKNADIVPILESIHSLLKKTINYDSNYKLSIRFNTYVTPIGTNAIGYKEIVNGTYDLNLGSSTPDYHKKASFREFNSTTQNLFISAGAHGLDSTKYDVIIPRKEKKLGLIAVKNKTEILTNTTAKGLANNILNAYIDDFDLKTIPKLEILLFDKNMNVWYFQAKLKKNSVVFLSKLDLNENNMDSYVSAWYNFDVLDNGNENKNTQNTATVLLDDKKTYLSIINTLVDVPNRNAAATIIDRLLTSLTSNNRVFSSFENNNVIFSINSETAGVSNTYYFNVYLGENAQYKRQPVSMMASEKKAAIVKRIATSGLNGINGFEWENKDDAQMQNSVWKFKRKVGNKPYIYSKFMQRKGVDLLVEARNMINSIFEFEEIDNITFLFSYIADSVSIKTPYTRVLKYTKNTVDHEMMGNVVDVTDVQIQENEKFTIDKDFQGQGQMSLPLQAFAFLADTPLINRVNAELVKHNIATKLNPATDVSIDNNTSTMSINLTSPSANTPPGILDEKGAMVINIFRNEFQKLVQVKKNSELLLKLFIKFKNNPATARRYVVDFFKNGESGIVRGFTYAEFTRQNYENALRVGLAKLHDKYRNISIAPEARENGVAKNLKNSDIVLFKFTGTTTPPDKDRWKIIVNDVHNAMKGLLKKQEEKKTIRYQFLVNDKLSGIGMTLETDFDPAVTITVGNFKVVEKEDFETVGTIPPYLEQLRIFLDKHDYFKKNENEPNLVGKISYKESSSSFYSEELLIKLAASKSESKIDEITNDIRNFLYSNYKIGEKFHHIKIVFYTPGYMKLIDKIHIRWIESATNSVTKFLTYISKHKYYGERIRNYYAETMMKGIEEKYNIKYIALRRGINRSNNRNKLENSLKQYIYWNKLGFKAGTYNPATFYFLKEFLSVADAVEYFEKNRGLIEKDIVSLLESFGAWRTQTTSRLGVFITFTYKIKNNPMVFGVPNGTTKFIWNGNKLKTTSIKQMSYETVPTIGGMRKYVYESDGDLTKKYLESFNHINSYANSLLFQKDIKINNKKYKIKSSTLQNNNLVLKVDQINNNNNVIPAEMSEEEAARFMNEIIVKRLYKDYNYPVNYTWKVDLKINDGKGTYISKLGYSFVVTKQYTVPTIEVSKISTITEAFVKKIIIAALDRIGKPLLKYDLAKQTNEYTIKIHEGTLNTMEKSLLQKTLRAYIFEYITVDNANPITFKIQFYSDEELQSESGGLYSFRTIDKREDVSLSKLRIFLKSDKVKNLFANTDFEYAAIESIGTEYNIFFKKRNNRVINEASIEKAQNVFATLLIEFEKEFEYKVNYNTRDALNPTNKLKLLLSLVENIDSFDRPIGEKYAQFTATVSLKKLLVERQLHFLKQAGITIQNELKLHPEKYAGLEYIGFDAGTVTHLKLAFDSKQITRKNALDKINVLMKYLVEEKSYIIEPGFRNFFVLLPKKVIKYTKGDADNGYKQNDLISESIKSKNGNDIVYKYIVKQQFSRGIEELTIKSFNVSHNHILYQMKNDKKITNIGLNVKGTLTLTTTKAEPQTMDLAYSIRVDSINAGESIITISIENAGGMVTPAKLEISNVKWRLLGQYMITLEKGTDGPYKLEYDYDKNWTTIYLLNEITADAIKDRKFNFLQLENFSEDEGEYEQSYLSFRMKEDFKNNTLAWREKILTDLIQYFAGKGVAPPAKELVDSFDDILKDHTNVDMDSIIFRLWSRDYATVTTMKLETNWINWGNDNAVYNITSLNSKYNQRS